MVRHVLQAVAVAVMLSLPAAPAWAGFDEGLAAYKRGDYGTALREFRPLAHRGDAAAQHNLGLMYTKGQGVPQDNAEAVKWYRKAANQGFARAQHNLGIMYDHGLGVQLDDAEAVKWYRKSANQGVADSQHNLGAMYANGDGVPRDYSEAVKLYRRAANQGLVNSLHNLGILYAKGEGVPRDVVRAHIWLTLAVAQGYEESIKARKIVAKSMTASQLAEAQKLAKNWRPNQKLDLPNSRRPSPDPKRHLAGYDEAVAAFKRGDYGTALRELLPLANKGHADAQYNLGVMYRDGTGVPKDNSRAVKWYLKAANQGHAKAQANIGYMYRNGWGVPRDNFEAFKWYRKAAKQGLDGAQFSLGVLYHGGEGVAQDYTKAAKWFRKAAVQGNANGQYNLGVMYDKGTGVPQDNAKAAEWYRLAAVKGHAKGQFNLGVMYDKGTGVPLDYVKAVKWYRKAAVQGHAMSQFNLGVMYDKGTGVPQDNAKAAEWYRLAANQGYAKAQSDLGVMYQRGLGVPRDNFEAFKWYRKAANQGHARSQFNLGVLYLDGEGVTQNHAEAVKWFKKAANQDYTKAQFSLGILYRDGEGVTQNHAEAAKWFKKAANQGYTEAQFSLGLMCGKGQGVPQSYVRAYIWLSLAAAQGHKEAAKGRGIVAKGMSNYQLAVAQKLAKNWRPNQRLDLPNSRRPFLDQERQFESYDEGLFAYRRGDYGVALRKLRPIANQGHARAQYRLGIMYAKGEGVPRDLFRAHIWFSLAAAQGHEKAAKGRGIVAEGLTRHQLAEAKKLAKNWRPNQKSDQLKPRRPDRKRASPGGRPKLEATGSGFFITADGFLLTNHHVIKGCAELRIKSKTFEVMAVDKGSDLALLKGVNRRGGHATFRGRRGVRLGEDIVTAGFPLQGLLTTNINVTKGTVSAMAGPGDDRRRIQITAPIQPGNSGGPVFDQSGHVVGVVVSKLSALSLYSKIGALPENVNFAVSEGTTRAFLDAEAVNYKTAPSTKIMSTADIAAKAKGFTVLVECWN